MVVAMVVDGEVSIEGRVGWTKGVVTVCVLVDVAVVVIVVV